MSLRSDRWIQVALLCVVLAIGGMCWRIVSSAAIVRPPAAPAGTGSSINRLGTFLGTDSLLGPGATFQVLKACAAGERDLPLNLEMLRDLLRLQSTLDSESTGDIQLRLGVARTPYVSSQNVLKLGWPCPLVSLDRSGTEWLTPSDLKPRFSVTPGMNRYSWLGATYQWAKTDSGGTLSVTWGAVWVAFTLGSIAFLTTAALFKRRRWHRSAAAMVCLAVAVGAAAWPTWYSTSSGPVGFTLDQTLNTDLSVRDFERLAASSDGRRELATRIVQLARTGFRYEPGPLTQVASAAPRPRYRGVVTSELAAADLPADAIPVLLFHNTRPPVPAAKESRMSWNLPTIHRTQYDGPSIAANARWTITADRFENVRLTYPTRSGSVIYSFWISRLAIEFSTLLAIPLAIIVFRVLRAWQQESRRARKGECLVCGYDLRTAAA